MKQTFEKEEDFLSENGQKQKKSQVDDNYNDEKFKKSYRSLAYNPYKTNETPIEQEGSEISKKSQNPKQPNLEKEIKELREKIKEEEFLIEMETAVHKELMSLLAKKKLTLLECNKEKFINDNIFDIYEHTENYLDKAENYVKNMKKLQQFLT